jgi:hypothetical protein
MAFDLQVYMLIFRGNGLPDASACCIRFNQLVCRKIMNARNEIRRQTVRAVVGTAETENKSENQNIYFFNFFFTNMILFSSMLQLMNKEFLYYIHNSIVLLRN